MTLIRVEAHSEGETIGFEPMGWTTLDTETGKAVSFDPNPNYVRREYRDLAEDLANFGPYEVLVSETRPFAE